MNNIETGILISISSDTDWHATIESAARPVGLLACLLYPETQHWERVPTPAIVALDGRLLTDDQPIPAWRARLAETGVMIAALLVACDPSEASSNHRLLNECDDLISLDAASEMRRALIRARNLAAERIARANAGPRARSRIRATLTERMTDIVFQLSEDLTVNYINPAWQVRLGHDVGETLGRSFLDYVLPDGREEIGTALRNLRYGSESGLAADTMLLPQEGPPIWMELRAMADPRATGSGEITGLLLDISARRESDAELRAGYERYRQMALRDPLTGLSNRLVFADRLQHALDVGARRGSGLALLFIDLDNFKPVNDTFGHSIGDRVLAGVAARLSEHIRAGDTIARYGGDEFAVILEDLSDPTQALQIADRLIETLRDPIKVGVEEISVGVSVGITLLTGRSVSYEEAIGEADVALYEAKQAGRNQFSLYESSQEAGTTNPYRFDLRRGMQSQELTILYLPIFNLESGEINGVEARVRWNHPRWGMLKPAQFLRRADASEVMGELAREALTLIATDIADWRRQGVTVPQIRVAMSVWQALDSDLIGLFTAARTELDLPGEQFAIELMDGSNPAERDAVRLVLEGLRELGLAIGFDNFITGGTPLGGVVEMNPAYVNLYASGHALADKGLNSGVVVHATRSLCDAFGWMLVAKDIDTPEMLTWLEDLPIQYAQGDALAPGVDAAGMLALLQTPSFRYQG